MAKRKAPKIRCRRCNGVVAHRRPIFLDAGSVRIYEEVDGYRYPIGGDIATVCETCFRDLTAPLGQP